MAGFVPKDNSGALFVNDDKQRQTHPDHRGSCMVDGVEYWVSAWENTSARGMNYLSLSFTGKDHNVSGRPPADGFSRKTTVTPPTSNSAGRLSNGQPAGRPPSGPAGRPPSGPSAVDNFDDDAPF